MKKLPSTICLALTIALTGFTFAEAPPLLAVEFQLVEQQVVGLVPEGLRLDGHVVGTITEGAFAGATVEGIDYVLIRHDGVVVQDVRFFGRLPDGTTVAWTLKGFAGDPATMPPLEAWLDPEFVPDMVLNLHGAAWFQTMAPSYGYLNHTVLAFDGTLDMTTGTVRGVYRSLAR